MLMARYPARSNRGRRTTEPQDDVQPKRRRKAKDDSTVALPSVEKYEQQKVALSTVNTRLRMSSEEECASRLLSLARTPELSSAPTSRASSLFSGIEASATPETQPEAKRRKVSQRPVFDQPVPPFSCPSSCEDIFFNVISYRRHIHENHKDDYDLCMREDCTKTVAAKDGMTMSHHYKIDHGLKLLNCNEHPKCNYRGTFDEQEYNKHVASHKLRCTQCLEEGKRALPFGSEKTLREHVETAHAQTPFFCNIYDVDLGRTCDKQFASEKARSQHGSRAHRSNYLCAYCQMSGAAKSFTTEVLLAKHVKDAHKDKYDVDWAVRARDKTYLCPICEKHYSSASNRAKHIRSVHEKERKWQCNETDISDSPKLVDDDMKKLDWDHKKKGCTKRYANKQTLIDHVRDEHFDLLRWEPFAKQKSGETARKVFERLARKRSNKPADAAGVLTGMPPRSEAEEENATKEELEDE